MSKNETTKLFLAELKLASPCPMQWSNMEVTAEEAVRFCGQCSKNVYDASKMSGDDLSLLMQRAQAPGSNACLQLYRRADGTIITDDCPVGLRRVRDFWRRVKSSAAAAVAVMFAALPAFSQSKDSGTSIKGGVELHLPNDAETPFQRLPTAGVPVMIDWRGKAMGVASVKKISDQVDALQKKQPLSFQDRVKVLRLRIDMAREAERSGVPAFTMSELIAIESEIRQLPDQTSEAEHREKISLLRVVLVARRANAQALKLPSTIDIDSELNKLDTMK